MKTYNHPIRIHRKITGSTAGVINDDYININDFISFLKDVQITSLKENKTKQFDFLEWTIDALKCLQRDEE